MISRNEYLALMKRIVVEVAPSETTAFAVAGPQIADALFTERSDPFGLSERRASEFQFLDSATQVLQFVGLMIGTFNTIRSFIKTVRSDAKEGEKQALVSKWTNELRHYGLPEAKAKVIADRFGNELAKFVEK